MSSTAAASPYSGTKMAGNADFVATGRLRFIRKSGNLKVVGNEKIGRSQMLGYGPGQWRLRFIFNLNMQFLSKKFYFLFRL
jgi:hypothetical protein